MEGEWHYFSNDEQVGPVGRDELRGMAENGELARYDLVWTIGMSDWMRAGEIRDLFPGPPPEMLVRPPPQPTPGLAIAGLICSCLGVFVCGLLGILGLILSIYGLKEANHRDGAGKGLAIAGIAVGGVSIAMMVIGLVMYLFFFAYMAGAN